MTHRMDPPPGPGPLRRAWHNHKDIVIAALVIILAIPIGLLIANLTFVGSGSTDSETGPGTSVSATQDPAAEVSVPDEPIEGISVKLTDNNTAIAAFSITGYSGPGSDPAALTEHLRRSAQESTLLAVEQAVLENPGIDAVLVRGQAVIVDEVTGQNSPIQVLTTYNRPTLDRMLEIGILSVDPVTIWDLADDSDLGQPFDQEAPQEGS